MSKNSIAIIDYGSQYTQLIARRVRELNVYCEIFAWDTAPAKVLALNPAAYILSGGPNSVYDPGAPTLPQYILDSHAPVLGVCYGMQLMAHALGGRVASSQQKEYGPAEVEITDERLPLFSSLEPSTSTLQVWMSHGDRIDQVPAGFHVTARSTNSPIAASLCAEIVAT